MCPVIKQVAGTDTCIGTGKGTSIFTIDTIKIAYDNFIEKFQLKRNENDSVIRTGIPP